MSKHVSYRGVTIDMDSLRRDNEKAIAIGNMGVNAKGDVVKRGVVIKTADQIARENHRTKSAIINTGLKGPQPEVPDNLIDTVVTPGPGLVRAPKKKKEVVEKELPSGDIIIEGDNNAN